MTAWFGILAAVLTLIPVQAGFSSDLPPFEIRAPESTEPGRQVTISIDLPHRVPLDELQGLLEVRPPVKIPCGAGDTCLPFRPTIRAIQDGIPAAHFVVTHEGDWEIVVLPDVADRTGFTAAGYPDRLVIRVEKTTPGWVTAAVLVGLSAVVGGLFLAAYRLRRRVQRDGA